MPTNKNALTRYKYLDEMLSDRHHFYDIHDLTKKCNEKLIDAGFPEVSQRCVEKDINYLEYDPFYAEIERYRVNKRRCIRYKNPSFTIFRKELSEEESNLILEILNTIGQFDGLANFEWLDRLKIGLGLKKRSRIISFSNNPYLQNSNLLGVLFDNISNQVVVRLEYHTFTDKKNRTIIFHPYLLKQYNDRWYLIGAANDDAKILNFALDRIDVVTALPEMKYKPCNGDLANRFEDIIGVTLYEDKDIEHILFWVSNRSKDYMETKPIHGSQCRYKGKKDEEFRSRYPSLYEGAFFSIDCIPNYELIRELSSFGKDLLVIEPKSVQDDVFHRVQQMYEDYLIVRT
jgi:predicted DNA-binding transcriptional regulator YafY